MSEPQGITRFRQDWTAVGGAGEIVVLPDGVHTAALAAEALGCEVGAITNSLVFDAAGSPVLLLTSGAHRVDVVATAERIGVPELAKAAPAFVKRVTGQVIGGVAPWGHPAPIRTYIDPWLRRYPVLWAGAGHPSGVVRTDFDELVRLTNAVEIEVDRSTCDRLNP